jgi:heme o synthase
MRVKSSAAAAFAKPAAAEAVAKAPAPEAVVNVPSVRTQASPADTDAYTAIHDGADAVVRTHRSADFLTLTKPRLNLLVLMTTLGGIYLGAPGGVPLDVLFHTVVGTALVAGGAAALNQVWERNTDRLMRRTAGRPLPAGRLGVAEGTWFGVALSAIGLVELTLGVNVTSAWVAGVTLISYVLMYTPLKTRTSLATLVGAIPGALPPVIGWAAAQGSITLPAIVLFGIVFFWQMPHFLAIAWMYRADYARAGIQMLPAVESDGRRTSQQALLYAAGLWPVSLMPLVVGLAGPAYGAVASVLGLLFIWLCFRFTQDRSHHSARRLFLFSITYLPILWAALVIDRLWL